MLKTLSKTEWWLMGDINKALKEKYHNRNISDTGWYAWIQKRL